MANIGTGKAKCLGKHPCAVSAGGGEKEATKRRRNEHKHHAFKVETGECIFLPKFKPHAFLIRSPRLRILALFSPAGLEEAFRSMDLPAQSLDLPTAGLTYSTDAGKALHGIKQMKAEDLKHAAQRLGEYGVRLLAPDQIAEQLPLYPKPLPPVQLGRETSFAV